MMASNLSDNFFEQPFASPREDHKEIPKDLEEFDPFQIGVSTVPKKLPDHNVTDSGVYDPRARNKLAPRIDVKFKLHEEVTSFSDPDGENSGSSKIVVEGTVQAQVTSSDALKNSPFILVATSSSGSDVGFTADETYARGYSSQALPAQVSVIKIPKSSVEFVTVGTYNVSEKVVHMPMLLERKINRSKAKLQIAIQVRSKLSNPDDMKDMSILLAISDKIAGDTVVINSGEGEWDRITRTITWTLDRLPKGESFMVSVRANLTEGSEDLETSKLDFPVLLRCHCNDQISSTALRAIEASGYPATVSSTTVQASFRIVHRLN